MKRRIIPFFLSNRGCPSRCIFCSRQLSAGISPLHLSRDYFRATVETHLRSAENTAAERQIAFYGGNFTGMRREDQQRLLEFSREYIDSGVVDSVRISTRPDFIDADILGTLKAYSVKTVEIGAQSMIDSVLERAERGHRADDTRRAFTHLHSMEFDTVAHLMIGLPGDTDECFSLTVEETVRLQPHAVRVHPTLVLKDTPLASLYDAGAYLPLSVDHAVSLASRSLLRFRAEGIPVIRMGLFMPSETDGGQHLRAGPYHPAFGTLVESHLFLKMASSLLETAAPLKNGITFLVSPSDVSNLRGLHNGNMRLLASKVADCTLHISESIEQKKGILTLTHNGKRYSAAPSLKNVDMIEITSHGKEPG